MELKIKPKDIEVCLTMVGRMIRVRTEGNCITRGIVTRCDVVRYENKKPVWRILLLASKKYEYKYETAELAKLLDGKLVDDVVRVVDFKEEAVGYEVAMFSPGFPGSPRINTW